MAQQAWYKRYEEYRDEALRYLKIINKVKDNSPQSHELRSFSRFADVALIFESNTIERAGTKTKGETREIIEKYFPQIPDSYRFFQTMTDDFPSLLSKKQLNEMAYITQQYQELQPSISFQKKSRGIREVLQHQMALIQMRDIIISLQNATLKRQLLELQSTLSKDDPHLKELKDILNEIKRDEAPLSEQLFNEQIILNLHSTLAHNLLPSDAEVEAGNYRIHDIEIVGADVKFPAPELVLQAMKRFIEQSNARVKQVLSGKWGEFIMVAAEVSYNFVRIHPFPDFNGRMSRLLLAMTLRAFGVPFNLALRGSVAKYRARYFYALKRANHGDLKPYATLIAMRIVESFQEIDDNLRLAGQKTLLELDSETP